MNEVSFSKWKERMIAAAKPSKTPVCATFELTPRCNLDCKMCYVHNQNSNALRDRELDTETWKRVFDEAYDCGMLFATLTGGECLLREDFKELYLHLWNKNVMITVMTNATMLDADYVEFFKTYTPERIRISLYGSCEDGYLALAGHKGFEKATAAIEALQEAGIDVLASALPNRYMTDDYIETLRLCKERNYPTTLMDVSLTRNRENPEKDDYFLTIDETVDLMVRRDQLYRTVTPCDCVPEPGGDMSAAPEKGMSCNAGNCLVTVTYDGRMFPCGNALIGEGFSLLEMSYAEAWEKTKAVADTVVHGAECVGCPYDKLCPKCPTFRLKDLHSGHCNPEVCELNRRLVAAGVKKLDQ